MGALALPFMIASTAMQAVGSVVQGAQERQQGLYEAGVDSNNAQIEQQNAATARQQSAAAQEAQQREARMSLGSAAAAEAQAGVGTGGTAGRMLKQSSNQAKLDAMNIQYGGELQAQGHLQEAQNYMAASRAAKRRANGAMISGIIGAGSSILQGVSNYGQYQAYSRMDAAYSGRVPRGVGTTPYGFNTNYWSPYANDYPGSSGYGLGSGP